MKIGLRIALAIALVCGPVFAGPTRIGIDPSPSLPRLELPRAIEGLLPTGLRVVVAPRTGSETVALRLSMRGGASVEAKEGRGAALAAAATLASYEPAGFAALTRDGGVVAHEVGLDSVEISVEVGKADFERALKALSTAVSRCAFDDADVARGKNAIEKPSNDAAASARLAALEALFVRSEASRGVDAGRAREVSGAAVRGYAEKHLRSASAVLAICGEVDAGEAFHAAREAFASWERTKQPAFERVAEPARPPGPMRANVESERGRSVSIVYPVLDRDADETMATRSTAELLRLRFPRASVVLEESVGQAGRLSVTASFEWDEIEAARNFEAEVLGFSAELAANPLDLSGAREALALSFARDLSTVAGVAARMARDGAVMEDVRASEREYAALASLTADRVVEVARKRLDPAFAAIGIAASVQRAASGGTEAFARGAIENGPSYVIDRRPGTGFVSIALEVPNSVLPAGPAAYVANARFGALLAEVAAESGAVGAVGLEFDERSYSIAFDALPARAEAALAAIFSVFRGEEPPGVVLERARKRGTDEFTARRSRTLDLVYEYGLGNGTRFADDVLAGKSPWVELSVGHFVTNQRAGSARLAIVGDFDPARLESIVGTFAKGSEPEKTPLMDPSDVAISLVPIVGTSPGRSAVVARVFPLESVRAHDSNALDTLASHDELLAELSDHGYAPAFRPKALRLGRRVSFPMTDPDEHRYLIVALEVAPSDVEAAKGSFEFLLDAVAKRGVTAADLSRAKKERARRGVAESRTTLGQARALLADDSGEPEPDAGKATASLRRALASPSPFVLLEPAVPAPGPRPARSADDAKPTKTPSEMSIPELEAAYGENLLVPDPDAPQPIPASQEVDVLRRWYGDPPANLNMSAGRSDSNVVDSLCEYIAFAFGQRHAKDPGKWAPGVAEFASWSSDHRVVTVRLRGDVTWQFPAVDRADERYRWLVESFERGAPKVTAHDVAFTHRVFMDPGAAAGSLRGAYAGTRVRVLDERTYQVAWEEPTILSFVYSLNFQTILPEFLYSRDESGEPFPAELLGKAVLDHWYGQRMCGYGPYEFVRMEPNERIVLRRKDDFPVFRPAVKELRWEILRDPEQVVQRMLQGQLDAITLQPQQFKQYWLDAADGEGVKRKGLRSIPYLRAEYFYIGMNCRRPQLADPKVRRALTHAVNREAIVSRAYQDFAELVDGHFRREHPHRLEAPSPRFDLAVAGALLEEAGWEDRDDNGVLEKRIDGKDVEFRITFTTFAGAADGDMIASILKSDLQKLGISLEVISLSWPQMQEAVFGKRDFDCFLGNWGTAYEVDPRGMFHSRNAADGANYGGYANPRVDELVDAYVHEFDPSKRLSIAHELQAILRDDPPYVFLLRRQRMTVVADWLDHVEYSPYRPQLLSFGWRKKVE